MVYGPPPSALIVSRDSNDALVVQAYFRLCGIASITCSRMEAPGDFRGIRTVVIFPDDFSALSSAQGVRLLIRRFPTATVIVITFGLAFFEGLVEKLETTRARVFVLPRTIWGWTVLDRIVASRRQVEDGRQATSAAARE